MQVRAIHHFVDFHKGFVNLALHIVGFAGILYSIRKLNWILFAASVIVLESGHVYNHAAGIKSYDLRPKVIFWRVTLFITVILIFFLLSQAI